LDDKFVIGEEFLRPWNRKITTNWENWLTGYQKTSETILGAGAIPPSIDLPLGLFIYFLNSSI